MVRRLAKRVDETGEGCLLEGGKIRGDKGEWAGRRVVMMAGGQVMEWARLLGSEMV